MKRSNNLPFNIPAVAKGAPSYTHQHEPRRNRPPPDVREGMIHIQMKAAADNSNIHRVSTSTAKTVPAQARGGKAPVSKWKSSFRPIGDAEQEDDNSQEQSTTSPERVELYDPYDTVLSDSDDNRSPLSNEDIQETQHLSPGRECLDSHHWDSSYSEPGNRVTDRREFSPEVSESPLESRGPSLGHHQVFSPETASPDGPDYGSTSRPLDHRGHSSDRHIHSSSTQRFSGPYGGQTTDGPEYRAEIGTSVRLSPPRVHHNYKHHSGLDQIIPVTRKENKSIIMDREPISCDLCDVELANGQELEDHLETKTHWDTLELIQQHNNYDDITIAFLQDVMLYKGHNCSRAIEESALQALQENDHMTKVEMFHCAACNTFVSTSALSVQSHITSQEHLSNTKEFEVQQRRTCLDKAKTMMEKLQPQFEDFKQGISLFN
ncbi:DBIRD complex subunit ZNF326 isoform X1 [Sphaeramia orbicularis]|uniref:C2H2-type domain-containing protein n=1 Tax=Sphaeramia orbicularis TaxID=375764 RepID=A0A672Z860_9TELE|nr:DBIRD complex subunit ZNF326 isoform X1 [Sphaeramia orbicularis]